MAEIVGQIDRGHAATAQLPLDAVVIGKSSLEGTQILVQQDSGLRGPRKIRVERGLDEGSLGQALGTKQLTPDGPGPSTRAAVRPEQRGEEGERAMGEALRSSSPQALIDAAKARFVAPGSSATTSTWPCCSSSSASRSDPRRAHPGFGGLRHCDMVVVMDRGLEVRTPFRGHWKSSFLRRDRGTRWHVNASEAASLRVNRSQHLIPPSRLSCYQKPRRAVSSGGGSISDMGLGRVELPISRLSDRDQAPSHDDRH